MNMLKHLREESENVVSLKGLCPDNKVPKDLLNEGKKVLDSKGGSNDRSGLFQRAKLMDSINESLPRVDSLDDL
jgi:serine/threonine-protein phosphatase 2B catalytic subunit